MLFPDETLVARIECAECGLVAAGVRAGEQQRGLPDAFVEPLGGGVAAFAEAGSPLNKVAGMGMDGRIDEGELGRIEALYCARQCPVQVELSTHADPSIGESLTRRGYRLLGFEDVLGCALSSLARPKAPDGIEIRASDDDDFDAWLNAVVGGITAPDAQGVPSHESFPTDVLRRVIGDMASGAGMSRQIALRAGALAGGASMRMADGLAQLCGAATLPAHRRKGVQTALLSHRLWLACQAGCDIAVVTTQPGSKSQENVRKQGFELLYSRAVLVRE